MFPVNISKRTARNQNKYLVIHIFFSLWNSEQKQKTKFIRCKGFKHFILWWFIIFIFFTVKIKTINNKVYIKLSCSCTNCYYLYLPCSGCPYDMIISISNIICLFFKQFCFKTSKRQLLVCWHPACTIIRK